MVKTKEIIKYYEFKNDPSLYSVEALKKTLKHNHGKVGAGNKAVLFNKVKLCLETESLKNLAYTKQIIKLQSHTRKYNTIKQMKLCNLIPSITKQLNNDSDFLICEHWKKNINYFFSYKDKDNFYYYFDIRSFDKLIKKGGVRAQNPYNRQRISLGIINKVNKRIKWLKSRGITLQIDDEPELDKNTPAGLKRIISDIFIELSTNGYMAEIEWFNKLNIHKCKILYRNLEDIWNYRTELTIQAKRKIAPPNGILFSIKPSAVFSIVDKFTLHKVIINNIKRLILDGETIEDRRMGMMYFIIGLSEVSHECMIANPWTSATIAH